MTSQRRDFGERQGMAYVAILFLLVILMTLGLTFVLKTAVETTAVLKHTGPVSGRGRCQSRPLAALE